MGINQEIWDRMALFYGLGCEEAYPPGSSHMAYPIIPQLNYVLIQMTVSRGLSIAMVDYW